MTDTDSLLEVFPQRNDNSLTCRGAEERSVSVDGEVGS